MYSTSFAWLGSVGLNHKEGFQARPVWTRITVREALGLILVGLGWDKSKRVKILFSHYLPVCIRFHTFERGVNLLPGEETLDLSILTATANFLTRGGLKRPSTDSPEVKPCSDFFVLVVEGRIFCTDSAAPMNASIC